MARKRNLKERKNFTKGGRVRFDAGGDYEGYYSENGNSGYNYSSSGGGGRGKGPGGGQGGGGGGYNYGGGYTTTTGTEYTPEGGSYYGIGVAPPPKSFTQKGGRTEAQAKETRELVTKGAEGKLPGLAYQDPTKIKKVTQNMDFTGESADETADAKAGVARGQDRSRVQTAKTRIAETPEEFDPSKIRDVKTVRGQTAPVDRVDAEWDPDMIQNMVDATLTQAGTGERFSDEQLTRGIEQQIQFPEDPKMYAEIVKTAGIDTQRTLRANRQLRRAGITEQELDILGTDPEVLEAELANYSEEQRGMIGNLPDEALASVQMNKLLDGIEEGEVPVWARPAVAAVNNIMSDRGLNISTVGRDALFNAIIQSAQPLAMANAQSIKDAAMQQVDIEAQAFRLDAQNAQQTALTNAQTVFQMQGAQFSADVQRSASNSKFLQTTSLTEVNNAQQMAMQEALSLANLDLANLDARTKLKVTNAQSFLQRDVAQLNADQQSTIMDAQMRQQSLLSDQSAINAAKQFNATTEQQTNQFMETLKSQTDQFNSSQFNAMQQFNATQANQAEAIRVNNIAEASRLNAQLVSDINKFNQQSEFAQEQFNVQQANAILQSNYQWRRQANTINTAAHNAVNQQNAQNALNLSTQSMAFLWQELRDQMDYAFRSWDNDQQRRASLMVAALGNEGASYEGKNWNTNLTGMTTIMNNFLN